MSIWKIVLSTSSCQLAGAQGSPKIHYHEYIDGSLVVDFGVSPGVKGKTVGYGRLSVERIRGSLQLILEIYDVICRTSKGVVRFPVPRSGFGCV